MSAKTRKFVFIVTAALLSLLTIWCEAVNCSALMEPLLDISDIGPVDFDGADFSIFFIIFASIGNAYFAAVIIAVLFIIITVITLLGWIIVGLISLRKAAVESEEFDFLRKAFVVSSVITSVIGAGITVWYAVSYRNAAALFGLVLLWQEPLFMWLFYIRKLKLKTRLGSHKDAL